MQQDGVESLQSDRESLKRKLSLITIGNIITIIIFFLPSVSRIPRCLEKN